jgi:hypothetical protein
MIEHPFLVHIKKQVRQIPTFHGKVAYVKSVALALTTARTFALETKHSLIKDCKRVQFQVEMGQFQ